MKHIFGSLAILFALVAAAISGCGSDSNDSKGTGGAGTTGGTSGTTGGSGGNSSMPAWQKSCHAFCDKEAPCDASTTVESCYDYRCDSLIDQGVKEACLTAGKPMWDCYVKQSDVCDQSALETACGTEEAAWGTACN